jgi:predicted ATPase
MNKISHLKISGFKRLYNIELEMRPLMVMIGANSTGKTSMLEILSLLSASADGRLNYTLNSLGGLANITTKDKTDSVGLSVEIPHNEQSFLKYELNIKQQGVYYVIPSEKLFLQQTRGQSGEQPFVFFVSADNQIQFYDPNQQKWVNPDWNFNFSETALSQVAKTYREPEDLRKTLSSISHYHALNIDKNSPVKLPQQMKPALLPGENGEDLFPFLYSLRENNPDRYETIIDTLKAAFPGFESLGFPPVAAGMLAMTWKEKYHKTPLYMNQLSEGMLRFLWLTALLQSPALPTITMIDEPEVSLHPELLGLLAHQMREASRHTQLIVATHSDRLIRFLEPKEVVVVNMNEEGLAEMEWADSLDLEEWLTEYSLDQLWSMGRLGGRP